MDHDHPMFLALGAIFGAILDIWSFCMELTGIKQNLWKIRSFINWRPHLISHEFHPYSLMPSPSGIRSEVHQLVEALGLFIGALLEGFLWIIEHQIHFTFLLTFFPQLSGGLFLNSDMMLLPRIFASLEDYFTVLCSNKQHATINLLEIQNFCVVSCLNPTNTESRIWRLLNFCIKWLSTIRSIPNLKCYSSM